MSAFCIYNKDWNIIFSLMITMLLITWVSIYHAIRIMYIIKLFLNLHWFSLFSSFDSLSNSLLTVFSVVWKQFINSVCTHGYESQVNIWSNFNEIMIIIWPNRAGSSNNLGNFVGFPYHVTSLRGSSSKVIHHEVIFLGPDVPLNVNSYWQSFRCNSLAGHVYRYQHWNLDPS